MIRRFSSMTLTGMMRCDVASGIARLAVMLSTMRAAAPRSGTTSSSGPASTGGVAGQAARGRGDRGTRRRGKRIEILPPAFIDFHAVMQEALIHLRLKPAVDSETALLVAHAS